MEKDERMHTTYRFHLANLANLRAAVFGFLYLRAARAMTSSGRTSHNPSEAMINLKCNEIALTIMGLIFAATFGIPKVISSHLELLRL